MPLDSHLEAIDRAHFKLTKDNIVGAKLAIPIQFWDVGITEPPPIWGCALAAPPHRTLRVALHSSPSTRRPASCCTNSQVPGDQPCVAATPARSQAEPPRRPSLTLTLTHRD